MKILVTGATGFLGTSLCRTLEKQGHHIDKANSSVADLRVAGSLAIFNKTSYDRIYHLAAWTQAGDFCLTHQGEQWVINQRINTNVLSWWQEAQPQAKMIALSTSCAYDENLPLKEENHLKGTPIDSLFSYAMTKRMLHVGLLSLQKQFGLKYLCLVPSTLYGEDYHLDGRQMHFIFDLIRKILRAKHYGETVTLWGDGHQKRELVYVHDFVRAMTELDARYENDLINIGAGTEYSIRYFAELICKEVGYSFEKIQFDTSKYVGAKSKCLSVEKLHKLLPGFTLTPLETGLKQTIAWFEREALPKLPR